MTGGVGTALGEANADCLHRPGAAQTNVEVRRQTIEAIRESTGQTPFVIVDYPQKVAAEPSSPGLMSIEKNRNGVDQLDLEFRKHFENNRFDTDGGRVAEELVDERIFLE